MHTEPPKPTTSVPFGTCERIVFPYCANDTTYNYTTFPNFMGHTSQQDISKGLEKYGELFNNPTCYDYSRDYWCSVWAPECKNGKRIPPCRNYCNAGKCVDVKPDEVLDACRAIGFNRTAFPNYVGDIRASKAKTPVMMISTIEMSTNCYKYATLFACAAYLPKCSGTNVVPSHTIPPCKSLCSNFQDRCSMFMEIFHSPWPEALNCSQFPDSPDTTVCIGYEEAHEAPPLIECEKGDLRCDGDSCIPPSWWCDGYRDCNDSADESHPMCASCPVGKHKCQPVGLCIEKLAVCDGLNDCYEDTDELSCVRLGKGLDEGDLLVYEPVSETWQNVCADDWNSTWSNLTCKQLGYE
ncbi:hypothetical protein KUTeg_004037 [Tegillarca granosa]|uniref:Atrial natriuretic peptide-converting enzyme n=1 Tax=Tegillarca granosa TaxID=220873 RepID=A0ABQ9FQF9_TEGGR|nr:hypothetical protein KUTeg_004037 [Tegillarca granosa]